VLTRVVVVTAAIAALMPAPFATADTHGHKPGPVQVGGDYHSGVVTTHVDVPGDTPASTRNRSDHSATGSTGVTCKWIENSRRLEATYRNWLGWGKNAGRWYDVRCSDGSVYLSLFVPPAANNVPAPVVLAGSLAEKAVNQLRLPVPEVHTNPQGQALVGLSEWLWVDQRQWRTLRQRTQAGPVWAVVTARPMSVSWDPGDGSQPVVCAGPGTPYDPSESADAQRTDCSYTYARSSASQPQTGPNENDRFFSVTVTTSWLVSWVGAGGTGGTLPVMTRSSTFPLAVAEREALVTGGSG
jgi:hypothetical protein